MATTKPRAFLLEARWPAILRDLGVQPRVVLRRAGLPGDLFSQDGASLSTPEYFRLWTAVEEETGGPTFSLRLGEVFKSESFHPLLFAALCSSNFAAAAQRIAHYKRLVAPMELHVEHDAKSLTLTLEWLDRAVVPPPSLAAFELVFFVYLIRLATRELVKPTRVQSQVPLKPPSEYTRFFGVRPQLSDVHAVTFSHVDGSRPFLTANEAMWKVFEPALRRRLADLDELARFSDRVRSALLEGLPGGESSMEDIAHKLGASKRTLQRRLHDEGTTFQAVLDSTREDLARHYLRRTKLSGAEISYLLGFHDPNSFFRAFHAWTGQTTEQARVSG